MTSLIPNPRQAGVLETVRELGSVTVEALYVWFKASPTPVPLITDDYANAPAVNVLLGGGTLDTNAAKLDNALGKLPELRKLLANDGATSADSGFVRRFKKLADAALGSDGVFESRNASIRANVTRNGKSQDAMEKRLEQTRARLQAQYSALDTKMATLNNLSTYMTQQIAQFNRSSG